MIGQFFYFFKPLMLDVFQTANSKILRQNLRKNTLICVSKQVCGQNGWVLTKCFICYYYYYYYYYYYLLQVRPENNIIIIS